MLDCSQFTSMICWLCLKTCRSYIGFSWMDISPSKKLIVSFCLKLMNNLHEAQHHHKDSAAFQKRFPTDVNCLEKAVISNLFMLEKVTMLINHDKAKFNDSVFENH